jgi:hypothetical protein
VSSLDDGLRRSRTLRFHRLNNPVGEFRGAGGAAYVPREFAAVAVDLVNRVADLHRSLIFTKVTQHEQGRSQHGSGIGDIFPGDVGRGAVDGFEDGALVAEIRAGDETEAADQSRAQIRKNVAVKILHQQDVVLIGVHHQLHAGVVDNVFAVGDLGILLRNVARAAQKQSIGQLHDVGFVDGMNFLALIFACILESKTRDACRGLLGDDLQALDHSGNDFVLDAGVESFGVFAHDDQVDARVAGWNMRQVADGAEVGEEFEALAEFDVDAGKAATDGRGHRALQSDAGALDGFAEFFGNVLLVFFERFRAGGETFPFKLDASGFEYANRGLDHFGADAIAGNESDFMCHRLLRAALAGQPRAAVPTQIKSGLCGFAFWFGRVFRFQEVFEFRHEFLNVFEVEIDGCESDIRDFVVAAEAVHDQFADFAGFALTLGGLDDEGLGFIHDLLELADRHRAFLAGAHQTVENFLAVKTLAAAVFLYNHVWNFIDALVGGEALFALQAFAAAADGIGFLAFARIHDFVIFKPAKGAFHALGCISEVKVIVAGRAARNGRRRIASTHTLNIEFA